MERDLEKEEEMNENDLRIVINKFRKYYIPMIKTAVVTEIPAAMTNLHTIAGIKTYHESNERKLKRNAANAIAGRKRQKISVEQQMIRDTLIHQRDRIFRNWQRIILPLQRPITTMMT